MAEESSGTPRTDWNGRPPPRERISFQDSLRRRRDRPARLTVGVVGAGRVGPALAAALQLAGHRPVAVSGVSDASVRRAADLLPDVPLVDPAEVLARADLVLLTVPDDALPGLVEGPRRDRRRTARASCSSHTSGPLRHRRCSTPRCAPARCRSPCTRR